MFGCLVDRCGLHWHEDSLISDFFLLAIFPLHTLAISKSVLSNWLKSSTTISAIARNSFFSSAENLGSGHATTKQPAAFPDLTPDCTIMLRFVFVVSTRKG